MKATLLICVFFTLLVSVASQLCDPAPVGSTCNQGDEETFMGPAGAGLVGLQHGFAETFGAPYDVYIGDGCMPTPSNYDIKVTGPVQVGYFAVSTAGAKYVRLIRRSSNLASVCEFPFATELQKLDGSDPGLLGTSITLDQAGCPGSGGFSSVAPDAVAECSGGVGTDSSVGTAEMLPAVGYQMPVLPVDASCTSGDVVRMHFDVNMTDDSLPRTLDLTHEGGDMQWDIFIGYDTVPTPTINDCSWDLTGAPASCIHAPSTVPEVVRFNLLYVRQSSGSASQCRLVLTSAQVIGSDVGVHPVFPGVVNDNCTATPSAVFADYCDQSITNCVTQSNQPAGFTSYCSELQGSLKRSGFILGGAHHSMAADLLLAAVTQADIGLDAAYNDTCYDNARTAWCRSMFTPCFESPLVCTDTCDDVASSCSQPGLDCTDGTRPCPCNGQGVCPDAFHICKETSDGASYTCICPVGFTTSGDTCVIQQPSILATVEFWVVAASVLTGAIASGYGYVAYDRQKKRKLRASRRIAAKSKRKERRAAAAKKEKESKDAADPASAEASV